MSYILDALRRADAERERGAVPSLQSQQHTIIEDDAAPARPRSLVWAVVALALAVLALLAWNFLGGSRAGACAHRRVDHDAGAGARCRRFSPRPRCRPRPCRPRRPRRRCRRPTRRRRRARAAGDANAAPGRGGTGAMAKTAVDARRTPRAERRRRRSESVPRRPQRRCRAGTAEPRVHSQAELPEEIRRDLPKLVIGGSSYSGDAASRMVMINGQVFHEGDRLAPDLVLERIRLKSAVLSFKGWRYEVLF